METIEITARYISENARMNFMPAAFGTVANSRW